MDRNALAKCRSGGENVDDVLRILSAEFEMRIVRAEESVRR